MAVFKKLNMRLFFIISFMVLGFQGKAQFSSSILIDRNVVVTDWEMCDFNNDGLLDVFGDSRFIYFQDEAGSVGSATEVSGMRTIVEVGDINEDGAYEIFAVDNSNNLYLNLNDGTGVFTPILLTDFNTDIIELGDFDGNGLLDILINSTVIKFQLTTGGTDFSTMFVTGNNPVDHRDKPTVIFDSDNDGKDELWYYKATTNTLFKTEYQSDGSLIRTAAFITTEQAVSFNIFDLDQDGTDELILNYENSGDTEYQLHQSLGNGVFEETPYQSFQVENFSTNETTILDIDNDGLPDLIGGRRKSIFDFHVSEYAKNRDNLIFTSEEFDQNCLIADINTDGKFDCVFSGGFLRSEKIYDYFEYRERIEVMGEYRIENLNAKEIQLELNDLNGDGHDDLFFGQFYKAYLPDQKIFSSPKMIESPFASIRYLGKLDLGNTGSLDNYWGPTFGHSITRSTNIGADTYLPDEKIIDSIIYINNGVTVADLDNDGDKDVIGQRYPNSVGNGNYYWWKNDGGEFHRVSKVTEGEPQSSSDELWPVDVDQDGDLDVIKTSGNGNDNHEILFSENLDGQGTFAESVQWTVDFTLGNSRQMHYFTTNTAGEIIAYGFRSQNNVNYFSRYRLENNVFIEQEIYLQGSNPIFIYRDVFDFNNDGTANLFYYGGDNNNLMAAELQADGTLGDIQLIHSTITLGSFSTFGWGDPDNDGDYDLFLPNTWYENLGGFDNWKDRQTINNSSEFLVQKYIDVDNDQDIDLLGLHNNRIAWYENYDGSGNFGTEQIIGDLSEDYSPAFLNDQLMVTADFNNDGTSDIIVHNSNGTLTLFNNVGEEDNLFPLDEKHVLNNNDTDDITKMIANSFTPDNFPDLVALKNGDIVISRNDPNFNAFTQWATILDASAFSTNSGFLNFEVLKIEGDYGKSVVGTINGSANNQLFLTRMTDAPQQFSDPVEFEILDDTVRELDIEIGDIDGDGDDDIVVRAKADGLNEDPYLYWFEQIGGDEIFAERKLLLPVPVTNISVSNRGFTLLDVNDDNKLDILIRNKVCFQLDNLEFMAPIEMDIDLESWEKYTFADLNGDDLPEFIIENQGAWWDNDKTEAATSSFINLGQSTNVISIWDINEDGTQDIYNSSDSYHANEITNRKSAFNSAFIPSGYSILNRSVEIVDIDGDGRDNLVMLREGKINYFQGVNYFNNPIPTFLNFGGTSNNRNPIIADMDNDGDMDIVYADNYICRLESIGNWNCESILPNQTDFSFFNIGLGDFNNDGYLDIVTLKESGVYLVYNQQGNSFEEPVLIYEGNDDIFTFELRVDDLDHDGKLDISFTFNEEILILFQENGTIFQEAILPAENIFINYLTGDLNQDGLIDLIYNDGEKLMVYFQTAPRTFTNPVLHYEMEKYQNASNVYYLKMEDVDNDSDLDLIYKIKITGSQDLWELYWAENVLNSNQVSGQVFYDENQNGIRDTLEQGLLNIAPELSPEGFYTYSEPNGRYTFYISPGEYNINYQENPIWDLTTNASSYPVSVPDDTILYQSGFDFGFYPSVDLPKVIPTITSGITRCNSTVRFFVEAINQGTQINSGNLLFVNSSDAEIDSFDIAPDLQLGLDTFVWNFDELYPSRKITRIAFLKMPSEQFTGNEIPFKAITDIQDLITDTTINTIYAYNPILLCAYDPNDKLVSPDRSGETNYTLFEESLEYTIRFQNTGNDTAFNIIIRDTLDPNLNWNTFQPLSSSHPYTVTRNDQGAIAFDFRNIMLPDSNVNFITSQGFVKFLIDPNVGLSENTVIENTAHIYFDFNAPIFTNTIINTMVSELPTTSTKNQDHSSFPPISLFPNPSNGIFNFGIPEEISLPLTLVITDMYGRETKRLVITNNREFIYRDFTLHSNVYFYQFYNANSELLQTGKLIKH